MANTTIATRMLQNAGRAAVVLDAMANEKRLALLCLLLEGERSVGDLALALGLSQPNVSQHLSRLKNAGLIAMRAMGSSRRYRLATPAARRIISVLHDAYCDTVQETRKGHRT